MPDPTPPTAAARASAVVIATRALGNDPRDLVDVIDHEQTERNIAAALREHARALRERCAAVARARESHQGWEIADEIDALEVP